MLSATVSKAAERSTNRFSPEFYDGFYGQFAAYNADLARVCVAAAGIADASHLVELGCGTGLFSQPLIDSFRPRQFSGIDPNAQMLAQAATRLASRNVALHCDDAENLPAHVRPGTADVIAIKAAYHHFSDRLPLDRLLGLLTDRGRLIIVERTPRSAATFPIFDDARAHWDACLARQAETAPHEHRSFLERGCYGRTVRMASKGYFEAIEHGQLSFTWPFEPELVRTWARLARTVNGEFVQVYEEFDVSVFGRVPY
jgi:trans-aconitate methyltransferase